MEISKLIRLKELLLEAKNAYTLNRILRKKLDEYKNDKVLIKYVMKCHENEIRIQEEIDKLVS